MTKRKIQIVDVDNYEDLQLQIQDEGVKQEPIREPIQELPFGRRPSANTTRNTRNAS